MKGKIIISKKCMRIIAMSMAVMSLYACSIKDITSDNNNQTTLSTGQSSNSATSHSSAASAASYSMTQSAGSATASCASASSSSSSTLYYNYGNSYYDLDPDFNTEEYSAFEENVFKDVSVSPLSTFSADVDTASYSNVRRLVNYGYGPGDIPDGSVRIEEMINYFTYDYKGPRGDEPFGVNAEISKCPWNEEHELVRIGLQTKEIDYSEAPPSNIVLLIDVSGSMNSPEKLPLVVDAFTLMLDNLGKRDTISIVTYANGSEIILDGESAANKAVITDALDELYAYGSTNGAGGIVDAYKLAAKNYIKDGNNRVIIASDGDFNVGVTSESELSDLIKEEAKQGIFLSVLGFGMGNYSDTRMETLADDGNGNYAYIDSLTEAKKVLVKEFCGNMVTVAKDVKFQVEFNPKYVAEYRLIGYENRMLNAEDFENDKKDAGEIGAGQSVTVLYEIVPAYEDSDNISSDLKYQISSLTEEALTSNEWLTLYIRYKEPDEDISKLVSCPISKKQYRENPSEDFLFCASVAEFGMLLRESDYVGYGSFKQIKNTLDTLDLNDEYKEEFKGLVETCL